MAELVAWGGWKPADIREKLWMETEGKGQKESVLVWSSPGMDWRAPECDPFLTVHPKQTHWAQSTHTHSQLLGRETRGVKIWKSFSLHREF